ncbi:hypothetical protein A3H19_00460 [Candidatus Woesebacteria bacterium RIFCSPLOWO2_12_FULL_39_9]|nr:MAG: hypothetical protein A3H19_00460 [Candidatus Woesebacteria bacterium RIFCSPLOWO2_12_FULL_39_9]
MKRFFFGIPAAILLASGIARFLTRLVDWKPHCADCTRTENVKAYYGGELYLCQSCMDARLNRAMEIWQNHPDRLNLYTRVQGITIAYIGMIFLVAVVMSAFLSQFVGVVLGSLPLYIVIVGFVLAFAQHYYEQKIKPNPKKWLKEAVLNAVLVALLLIMIANVLSGNFQRNLTSLLFSFITGG